MRPIALVLNARFANIDEAFLSVSDEFLLLVFSLRTSTRYPHDGAVSMLTRNKTSLMAMGRTVCRDSDSGMGKDRAHG